MIYDNLSNIGLYKNIPDIVIDFVSKLDKNISLGKHILSENIYANVEEYSTKLIKDGKFESHKNYIDIQLLLKGNEDIYYTQNLDDLTVGVPYNSEKDITFYSDKIKDYPNVSLNEQNFVMLFPHEAHAPQISKNNLPTDVLKVVIKIKY